VATEEPAPCVRADVPSLLELRKSRGLTLVQAAAGLRLGPDVWKKFETGTVLPDSVQDFQIARLAAFFEVSPLTFVAALGKSGDQLALAPPVMCYRGKCNRSAPARQSLPVPQLFETALARGQMSEEAKRSWLLEGTRL
jgi:transcriptional regulator with XRE-family HTH domain